MYVPKNKLSSTVTVTAEGNYSEPYNLRNKKLLPHHQYDVVTGAITFYYLRI